VYDHTKRRHLRSTSKADDSQSKRQSKSFFPQVEVAKPTDKSDKAVLLSDEDNPLTE
jgi:hypothetical protein